MIVSLSSQPLVLVGSADRLVRELLSFLIKSETGFETLPVALIEPAPKCSPSGSLLVTLVDCRDSLAALRFVTQVQDLSPTTPVLCLTHTANKESQRIAFQARAFALLQFGDTGSVLVKTIVAAVETQSSQFHSLPYSAASDQEISLSKREREILSLRREGATPREIADALGVSNSTVQAHLQNIDAIYRTAYAGVVLSRPERAVLEGFTSGQKRSEIARKLGLSPNTVRNHLRNIDRKLQYSGKSVRPG